MVHLTIINYLQDSCIAIIPIKLIKTCGFENTKAVEKYSQVKSCEELWKPLEY